MRDQILDWALEQPELSPCKLAVKFTHKEKNFVSEGEADQKAIWGTVFLSNVFRLLRSHDLTTSPAYIVIKGEGWVI